MHSGEVGGAVAAKGWPFAHNPMTSLARGTPRKGYNRRALSIPRSCREGAKDLGRAPTAENRAPSTISRQFFTGLPSFHRESRPRFLRALRVITIHADFPATRSS